MTEGYGQDYDPSNQEGEEEVQPTKKAKEAEEDLAKKKWYADQWYAQTAARYDMTNGEPKKEWYAHMECVPKKEWSAQGTRRNTKEIHVPKEYTPCLYFFNTTGGCRQDSCAFSHAEIFKGEPYSALLKSFKNSSDRKNARHVD